MSGSARAIPLSLQPSLRPSDSRSRRKIEVAPVPTPDEKAVDSEHRNTPAVWLATGLGLGLITPAPGTVGSLVWGMPLAYGISLLPGWWWQAAVVIALNLVGIPLCTRAGRDLGGKKDNQAIIWDEIATVPITFLWVPLDSWPVALLGFGLIRLFDISKPPPVRQVESLPEGLGVMADDVIAGIYACVSLAIVHAMLFASAAT